MEYTVVKKSVKIQKAGWFGALLYLPKRKLWVSVSLSSGFPMKKPVWNTCMQSNGLRDLFALYAVTGTAMRWTVMAIISVPTAVTGPLRPPTPSCTAAICLRPNGFGQSTWYLLPRIRAAMKMRDEHYVLQGIVEFDDPYFGAGNTGNIPGKGGRARGNHAYLRMQLTPNVQCTSIEDFSWSPIAYGSTVQTDGFNAYRSLWLNAMTMNGKCSIRTESFSNGLIIWLAMQRLSSTALITAPAPSICKSISASSVTASTAEKWVVTFWQACGCRCWLIPYFVSCLLKGIITLINLSAPQPIVSGGR